MNTARPFFLVLATLLLLPACPSSENESPAPAEAQPAAEPTEEAQAPAAEEAPKAAAAEQAKAGPDCEKLVPASIREKLFPGQTLKAEAICDGCPVACKSSEPMGPSVFPDCRIKDTVAAVRRAWGERGTELDGLGRVAYRMGRIQLIFVPEKHDCQITVTWHKGTEAQVLELGRAVDAAATKEALGL